MSSGYSDNSSIILVLGGISSGKSRFAEKMIEDLKKDEGGKFYYFTSAAEPEDDEMRAKIAAHKKRRPFWLNTVECGIRPSDALHSLAEGDAVLFDSVGTLAGRLMMSEQSESAAESAAETEISNMIRLAETRRLRIIFVTEEVGMTLVALSESGREFQRIMGKLNQMIAASAEEVYFITAGLPKKLK